MTLIPEKQIAVNVKTKAFAAAQTAASGAAGLVRSTAAATADLVPVGTTGLASIAAATQEDGRNAIGLEDLDVNRYPDGRTKSFNFNRKPGTGFYLANSFFGGELSNGVGQFVDRLLGADKRYNVTQTGFSGFAMFDAGYESASAITAGGTGTCTIDFVTPPETGYKFLYATGFLVFTFYEFGPSNIEYPASLLVEVQDNNGVWTTILNKTDFATGAYAAKFEPVFLTIYSLFQAKLRYTIVARTGKQCQLTKVEYFADRPDLFETPQYPTSAGARQDVHSEYLFTTANRQQTTLIGPGVLQFNGGAIQTASLRGSKTIGTASTTDTITVTGAAIGDIARVSRGKDAYVSAANTVTFDSTGLAGVTVSAIVERFV